MLVGLVTKVIKRVISVAITRTTRCVTRSLKEILLNSDYEELGLGGRIQRFFVHNIMIYL